MEPVKSTVLMHDSDRQNEPIATRQFEARLADGTVIQVELEIDRPHPTAGEDDWGCSYRITGLAQPIAQTVYGVDALQALVLCLRIVRVESEAASQRTSLTWLGDADLGLS